MRYVTDLRDLHNLHKQIVHGEIKDLDGDIIDGWQQKSENFFKVVLNLVDDIVQ